MSAMRKVLYDSVSQSRLRVASVMLATLLCLPAEPTNCANSIVVESKIVGKALQSVEIRVLISNDVPLRGLVVPLSLVKTTQGALQPFVTDIGLSFAERLAGTEMSEIVVTNLYPERDSYCPAANNSFGYRDISYAIPEEMHPVLSTPEGVLFIRMSQFSSVLPPGSDTLGSLVLTVNLTEDLGTFEIDTTNTAPCNTIVFVEATEAPYTLIKPQVTKGTITIDCECHCQSDPICDSVTDVLDVVECVNVAFRNAPGDTDPLCPLDGSSVYYADVDCSGEVDIIDVVKTVAVAFRNDPPTSWFCSDLCSGP